MRYLMLDRILEVEKGVRIVGVKNVTQSEDFFTHHFPDMPVMPGALTLEAMAQTAGRLICFSRDFSVQPMLLSVERARFKHAVRPGDQMVIKANLLGLGSRKAELSVTAQVGERVVAEAQLSFLLADLAQPSAGDVMRRTYEQLCIQ
jgi:3-hydroxyacyl-[acyl-carrier-protein] dehydratase